MGMCIKHTQLSVCRVESSCSICLPSSSYRLLLQSSCVRSWYPSVLHGDSIQLGVLC